MYINTLCKNKIIKFQYCVFGKTLTDLVIMHHMIFLIAHFGETDNLSINYQDTLPINSMPYVKYAYTKQCTTSEEQSITIAYSI